MPRLRAGAGRVLGWGVGDKVGETRKSYDGQRERAGGWWSDLKVAVAVKEDVGLAGLVQDYELSSIDPSRKH
jgi:hypothetical protein